MLEQICTACGSDQLRPISILHSCVCDGKVTQTVDSFYCTKCGHVELYARASEIEKCLEQEAKRKAFEEESRIREDKIKNLELEISGLRSIISDEDQTVKAVDEAKQKLSIAENELRGLKAKRSSVFTMSYKLY